MASSSEVAESLKRLLRLLYVPFLKSIRRNYLFVRRIILARRLTNEFHTKLIASPNSTITIKYDHKSSPPTYGDYFIILMIARFVSMSGFKVKFEIIDLYRSGVVWNALKEEAQDLFVLDQIELAKKFLNENCQIFIHGKFMEKSTPMWNEDAPSVSDNIDVYSESFYQWAPYFLHLLITKHKWQTPNGFLLEAKNKKPEFRFVAWNVRKSIWAAYRDTDANSLTRDFAEIRKLYPTHSVVILSNQEGLAFAVSELKKSDVAFENLIAQRKILLQPDGGFVGGINWVLHSDFYFQRSGGGMGIIAIFSSVPYLMYSIEKTSFFGHYRNKKIAPWSAEDQIFKRLFAKKQTQSISKSLN